jgi:LysR family glycine cleavage system transcriptional activator
MTYALPPLQWLRSFEAFARHLGFAAAARELSLTPAAVGQQVRLLERRLGFALFERLARGLRLTETGAAYLPSVRRAFEELSMATDGLFGPSEARTLTVRSAVSFAALTLAPRLPAFRAAHPAVRLRLRSAVRDDAVDAPVDVEIRWGDGRWLGADALRLHPPRSIAVCPPDTRFGADPAAELLAMAATRAIHVMGCENLWRRMAGALGRPDAPIGEALRVDASVTALALVEAGAGCALITPELAEGHLAAGRVLRAPLPALDHEEAHYVCLPRRETPPAPAALLFRDWLAGALESPPTGGVALPRADADATEACETTTAPEGMI